MLNSYRKYDSSFMEVILEVVSQKIDLTLESLVADYFIDKNYAVDYLTSPYPNTEEMVSLLAILKGITTADDKLILVILPLEGPTLNIQAPREQFRRHVSTMFPDAAARITDNEYYMNEFRYDPFGKLPLLFANIAELRGFLMSDDKNVFSLLVLSDVLLLPTKMDWLLLFNFNFNMLELMTKPNLQEHLKNADFFKLLKK